MNCVRLLRKREDLKHFRIGSDHPQRRVHYHHTRSRRSRRHSVSPFRIWRLLFSHPYPRILGPPLGVRQGTTQDISGHQRTFLAGKYLPSHLPTNGWRAASRKLLINGGPGRSRTADQRFRKPLLYPTELRGRCESVHYLTSIWDEYLLREMVSQQAR